MLARPFVLGAIALGVVASTAGAQDARDPRCTNPSLGVIGSDGSGGDACQKAVDLFGYMTPQLGSVIAGGNATLGQSGVLGGLGKFTVLLRVTALQGGFPDAEDASVTGGPATTPTAYQVEDMPLPLPSIDGALGIFKGIPLGITSVLGVDVLGSAFYVPEYEDGEDFSLTTPDGSFKFGYGARVGLVKETAMIPGVSVTYMQRELPRTTIRTKPSDIDDISLSDFDNKATSWRIVAGKKLGFIGLSAGYGKDEYEAAANLSWHVQQGTVDEHQGNFAFGGRTVEANNLFANLMLNLKIVKLVGEVGQVTVTNLTADDFYNSFSQAPDDSRLYGSFGFRIGH